MYLTIIGAKIFYGDTVTDAENHIATYISHGKRMNAIQVFVPIVRSYVQMNENQFLRFKNAGRRHASAHAGKTTTSGLDRTRIDRTGRNDPLEKWDVDHYGNLTGHAGPWGNRALTNRDHMTANSSNQIRNSLLPANIADSHSAVKADGLAITVSGNHHRGGSYTYGGRTKKESPVQGMNRMEFGAHYPTTAFYVEMNEMLEWKRTNSLGKSRLRVEMVGAYAYMYKKAVDWGVVQATPQQDYTLLAWTAEAVTRDDGTVRK